MSEAISFIRYPAPAKLNLDLRITARRADGYHELASVFTLIDWCDWVKIAPRADGKIVLHTPAAGVLPEQDLAYRAAFALKRHTQTPLGANIALEKHIPMGGGLGGGSSDAATVLLVLNHLWRCRLQTAELIKIGVKLGADVPFFLFGQSAFAQGIGEKLTAFTVPPKWYVVLRPEQHVATAVIFNHPDLPRNTPKPLVPTYQDLQPFQNDMQGVVLKEYPTVAAAYQAMQALGQPLMTGSGSCLFLTFDTQSEAENAQNVLHKQGYECRAVQGLREHPLRAMLK
ncbi:MAG: 4-(cytidine 5'-diphospho)-2-C-methyl-D-erythritol kinase [Neisseria sp.]|nr:4-(cytidine 5'-diphospho)-2-C-methyl-D-erythritol kinase [Neisseria sp.]